MGFRMGQVTTKQIKKYSMYDVKKVESSRKQDCYPIRPIAAGSSRKRKRSESLSVCEQGNECSRPALRASWLNKYIVRSI
jgi:hypothetical protein